MSSDRRPRVAILFDGYVPEYRRRFYELLAEQPGVEYVVFWGRHPSNFLATAPAVGPYEFPNVRVRNVELRLGRKTVLYQALLRSVVGGGFDAVIVGARLRLISNLIVAPLFKLRGRQVILWGHGAEPIGDFRGVLRRLLIGARHAKRWMARRGDGYLAYTENGRRDLIAGGLSPDRVFVVRNTIDTEEQRRIHDELLAADPQLLRAELGLSPSSVVLLCIGSVYREKRLEQVIDVVGGLASEEATRSEIELVVIGDGPDLEMIRARAADLPGVHFRGKVMDQEEVGRYMRVAAAVVFAGGVGLAVNHAFSQGVPVIMRADAPHGPEAEYVEDGSNGLVVDGTLDRFSEVLARFVDSPAEQERLARGALASRDALGIEQMARNFDTGVKAVLGYPSGSGAAANGNAALASPGDPLPEHPDPRPVS